MLAGRQRPQAQSAGTHAHCRQDPLTRHISDHLRRQAGSCGRRRQPRVAAQWLGARKGHERGKGCCCQNGSEGRAASHGWNGTFGNVRLAAAQAVQEGMLRHTIAWHSVLGASKPLAPQLLYHAQTFSCAIKHTYAPHKVFFRACVPAFADCTRGKSTACVGAALPTSAPRMGAASAEPGCLSLAGL